MQRALHQKENRTNAINFLCSINEHKEIHVVHCLPSRDLEIADSITSACVLQASSLPAILQTQSTLYSAMNLCAIVCRLLIHFGRRLTHATANGL